MLLTVVAVSSWEKAYLIGRMEEIIKGEGGHLGVSSSGNLIDYSVPSEINVAITSGYNGGALAMGLICCMCVFGIVWLEVNKTSAK